MQSILHLSTYKYKLTFLQSRYLCNEETKLHFKILNGMNYAVVPNSGIHHNPDPSKLFHTKAILLNLGNDLLLLRQPSVRIWVNYLLFDFLHVRQFYVASSNNFIGMRVACNLCFIPFINVVSQSICP